MVVAPSQRSRAQVIANGLNWNPEIQGVTPAYLTARDWEIARGRMFDETEAATTLELIGATSLLNGVAVLTYRVSR